MRDFTRYSGYSGLGCVCVLSCVRLLVTPWTVARQARLSMEFSRQGYWSKLPFPTSGGLPEPGIEPTSVSPALAGRFFTTALPGKLGFSCKKGKSNSIGLCKEVTYWDTQIQGKLQGPFSLMTVFPFLHVFLSYALLWGSALSSHWLPLQQQSGYSINSSRFYLWLSLWPEGERTSFLVACFLAQGPFFPRTSALSVCHPCHPPPRNSSLHLVTWVDPYGQDPYGWPA